MNSKLKGYLSISRMFLLLLLYSCKLTSAHRNDVKCGRVPIYENLYNASINETVMAHFNIESEDQGVEGFRILHGLDAVPGEWPWIVRIKQCNPKGCSTCTGSLINFRWVLSAGHCADENVNEFTATLGLYNLVTRDKSAIDLKIDKIVVHPEYSDWSNDLALFRLERPVEFNHHVQPVCLINEETKDLVSYSQSRRCYTAGYGLIEGMRKAVKLQKLSVRARPHYECNSDELKRAQLSRGTVCIGPNNENNLGSSCRGDSGGPNLCYDPEMNQWQLFGVVSYGPEVCDREENDKWLSVSVDLTSYRTWILSTAAIDS